MLIAYVADEPVGFVSGVETTHPDKGTGMFLYELAVAADHRRQGTGLALVRRLAQLARDRRLLRNVGRHRLIEAGRPRHLPGLGGGQGGWGHDRVRRGSSRAGRILKRQSQFRATTRSWGQGVSLDPSQMVS